jgi:hypothetical protein
MKLAIVIGDFKVSLEKIPQLLRIIKVCSRSVDLINYAMMYNKDSFLSSILKVATPFPLLGSAFRTNHNCRNPTLRQV